jgi:chorismate mutase
MNDLSDARKQIEILDQKLIELLTERMQLCKEIGVFKKENKLTILDPKREAELQELHKSWAAQNSLSPVFVTQLFELIFAHAKEVQD